MPKRQTQTSPISGLKRKQLNGVNGNKSQDATVEYNVCAVETWVALANCANTLGLTVAAIRSFESAAEHDPSNSSALCGLSYSLRTNDINLNETFGSQISIEKLNRSLETFPKLLKEPTVFKELAECYSLIGMNDQAHQAIQTAIQLSPNDALLWLLSAQTLIRAGARNHAAGSLAHCLSLLPDSLSQFSSSDVETARTAHAELAAIAAADGNIELSVAELTATLSLPAPPLSRIDEHIALWCALATARERINDIDGAIQVCESAEMAVGNSERILMTHAYLLLLSEKKERAKLAITLLSQNTDLEKERSNEIKDADGDFLPWYLLGKAYSILDEPRLAYDSYQVALRRAPNSPITMLAVGKLYLEFKQLPDALAAYSQALRLQMDEGSPATAIAWDGLSCVYERCDEQLMDASDACVRSAASFKAIGDLRSAEFFEDRAKALVAACNKEGEIPPLREPPDFSSSLLRDLVALLPSERIAFVQGNKQQSIPLQQAKLVQPPSNQQTPNLQNSSPASTLQKGRESHTPQSIIASQPQEAVQTSYSMHPPLKQEQKKSPKQPQQLPPPQRGWSPNQPQYFYQLGSFVPGQLPPIPGPPPPPLHQQHPSHVQRSPLANPMIPNAAYPVVHTEGPPPGYPYQQYLPMQGGVVTHLQQYAPPINNWKR
ncbi:uncharacterized protein PRCAT00004613001 [Priceomyces carsonii]|uniref:uncharacterized protein n=1 Tax=Priceomyces carsonii TaxID=28549 RepID=UPI002ED9E449|nr:unnamed protein product [Priceomyces carsonii]